MYPSYSVALLDTGGIKMNKTQQIERQMPSRMVSPGRWYTWSYGSHSQPGGKGRAACRAFGEHFLGDLQLRTHSRGRKEGAWGRQEKGRAGCTAPVSGDLKR